MRKQKLGIFYVGKMCGMYEIGKVLVFYITYFQGWSVVCSYCISLGISGKKKKNNTSETHKIKAPTNYKNVHTVSTQDRILITSFSLFQRGIQSKRH